MILRFAEGLLNGERYRQLKRLASGFESPHKVLITSVKAEDLDTLQKMVTAAAIFADETVLQDISENSATLAMLKKLSVVTRFILSGYRSVVDYGDGREEQDCRLSIVTPSAHIHLPHDVSDKKYERCVRQALLCARGLMEEGKEDMLLYYETDSDTLHMESKEDYIRRKYYESIQKDTDA